MQSTLSPLSAPWSTKTWPGIGTVIIGKGAKPWGAGEGGLYISYWICLSERNLFLKLFGKLNGKNKTINITNKKKGKERIVEKVVTGSVT